MVDITINAVDTLTIIMYVGTYATVNVLKVLLNILLLIKYSES